MLSVDGARNTLASAPRKERSIAWEHDLGPGRTFAKRVSAKGLRSETRTELTHGDNGDETR